MSRTRHKMLRADILRRGGQVLENTLEVRQVAETLAECYGNSTTGSGPSGLSRIGVSGARMESLAPAPRARVFDEDVLQLARRFDAVSREKPDISGAEAWRLASSVPAQHDL